MNKNCKQRSGFTLIELLMVIAIIGILAGILIPTVGAVRKQANIAAGKAQLSNYVNAVQMFKAEYKFYPFITGTSDENAVDINSSSLKFIETLSGKDADGEADPGWVVNGQGVNRKLIAFYSFGESDFFLDDDGLIDPSNQLADRFNNVNIFLAIDGDGDGFVTPTGFSKIKQPVTGYVTASDVGPAYQLWD